MFFFFCFKNSRALRNSVNYPKPCFHVTRLTQNRRRNQINKIVKHLCVKMRKRRRPSPHLATRLTNAPELSARRFEVSTRAIRRKQASRESVNRPKRERERKREAGRDRMRYWAAKQDAEEEEEKLAEEFALSSFPGFIFRAPSVKLPGISLVPFSSDNAALAACAKGWLTRKLAFSPSGKGRCRKRFTNEIHDELFVVSRTIVMTIRLNYQHQKLYI